MSNIDYGLLRKYTGISATAEQLLSRPEKETYFNLSLKISPDKVIQADSYVVYFNTVRGPAKGGIRMAPDVTLDETRDLAERMEIGRAHV